MKPYMNEIELYHRASQLRKYSKRIQQISYTLNQIEKRFNLDNLDDPADIAALIKAYQDNLNELILFVNEIKNEDKDNTN